MGRIHLFEAQERNILGVLAMIFPPISVLLIIQMAHITKLPSFMNWLILAVVPIAYAFSKMMAVYMDGDCRVDLTCPQFMAWLNISGMIAGAVSLLVIWGHRTLFSDILRQKAGKERYWLILSLIIVNILLKK